MAQDPQQELSRRERQIMEAVYRLGQASVADVRERLPEAPSYSAVRALLRILEEKGHLSHEESGRRYLYKPVVAHEEARNSALQRLLSTFFSGSKAELVATLLDDPNTKPSESELKLIDSMIRRARKEGR